jgi:hypothetical protein
MNIIKFGFGIFKLLNVKKTVLFLTAILLLNASFGQEGVLKSYSLITDLADTSATIKSMRMILNPLKVYNKGEINEREVLDNKGGLVMLLSDGSKVSDYSRLIKKYTGNGGTLVMDIRAFASLNNLMAKNIELKRIIVRTESDVTKGYKKGEPIVYNNKGSLTGLGSAPKKDITVLGESEKGDPVLVARKTGNGIIVAVDMLSLREPKVYAGTENKYLFLVNAIGNSLRFGRYFLGKLKYPEFVDMLKEFVKKYPSVCLKEEGDASGGNKIYSLSMGKPSNPGIFIYSNTHGNEWENSYGTFSFVQYLAEHPDQQIIDLNKYCLKVIPLLNPYGYEHMTRQNGNKVDLNRNGDNRWEKFIGQDPANYAMGVYDWKGTAPFSEPEAQTLLKAAESANFIAFLDIHGNPSGTGFNKSLSVSGTAKPDAFEKGQHFEKTFNDALTGRYILQQTHEKVVKPMLIDYIGKDGNTPLLYLTLSKDKYGYLVELLCGYSSTEFIVMQDDIVTELCVAFCKTFVK